MLLRGYEATHPLCGSIREGCETATFASGHAAAKAFLSTLVGSASDDAAGELLEHGWFQGGGLVRRMGGGRHVDTDVTWVWVEEERRELAALGRSLTREEWNAPSLCEGWAVRHVFAHVLQGVTLELWPILPLLVGSRFDVNRAGLLAAITAGDNKRASELLEELDRRAGSRRRLPGTTPAGLLAEAVVHGQDVRRPLGISGAPSPDRVVVALWSMVRTGPPMGNRKRIAGVRLLATDIDWSHGEGLAVKGTAEALLMATCGRQVVLDELEGPGVRTLQERE